MRVKVKYNWNHFQRWVTCENNRDKFSFLIKVKSSSNNLSKQQRDQIVTEIFKIK